MKMPVYLFNESAFNLLDAIFSARFFSSLVCKAGVMNILKSIEIHFFEQKRTKIGFAEIV